MRFQRNLHIYVLPTLSKANKFTVQIHQKINNKIGVLSLERGNLQRTPERFAELNI